MSQVLTGRTALRNIFLVLFLLSSIVFVVMAVGTSLVREAVSEFAPSATTGDDPSSLPSSQDANGMGVTAVIGSVVTSVTSLVGFIVTTVITWRKEKREASLAEVERKKLELELEKNRLELEELKKGEGKKKETRRKK